MMRGDGENGEGRKGMRGREGDERERGWRRRRKGNRPIVVITKPTSIVG
jgi:hypothetical protein